MRRINTATRAIDKYGPGRDAYQYLPAPTEVSDVALDHIQEELARILEVHGITLDPGNVQQNAEFFRDILAHAYQETISTVAGQEAAGGFIVDGLDLVDAGGLDIEVQPGSYIINGRRLPMTEATRDAIIPAGIITLADNSTSQIFMEIDTGDIFNPASNTFSDYTVGSLPDLNNIFLGRVVTSGGTISSIDYGYEPNTFLSVNDHIAHSVRPHFNRGLSARFILPLHDQNTGQIGSDLPSADSDAVRRSNFAVCNANTLRLRPGSAVGSLDGICQNSYFNISLPSLGFVVRNLYNTSEFNAGIYTGITAEISIQGIETATGETFFIRQLLAGRWDDGGAAFITTGSTILSSVIAGGGAAPVITMEFSGGNVRLRIANSNAVTYWLSSHIVHTATSCAARFF